MTTNRRYFLKSLGGVVALSWMDLRQLAAQELHGHTETGAVVQIIIPRSYVPPADLSENYYRKRLTRAILDFLEAHYRDKPMPVWHRRFGEVDLEKRVYNITYWLLRSVQEQRRIYPVDPVWLMAQMMKESYFYEFAVSSSLAVGICQFIQPTAEAYDMLCAGRRADHRQPPYREYHLAGKVDEYYRLRDEQRSYRHNHRPAKRFSLEETLQIIRSDSAEQYREAAGNYLDYLESYESFNEKRRQARDDFKLYLQANVEGRDIFDNRDLEFILNFDERFTYKKPVDGMVRMMAEALRARHGNILAAAIAYNAGLGSTAEADDPYSDYGKIPAIEQSTTYLSHVIVNHYEISRRMG